MVLYLFFLSHLFLRYLVLILDLLLNPPLLLLCLVPGHPLWATAVLPFRIGKLLLVSAYGCDHDLQLLRLFIFICEMLFYGRHGAPSRMRHLFCILIFPVNFYLDGRRNLTAASILLALSLF